ncbi:MAG: DUF547 domain-containing protein [Owenweeksia sp.]|nr:DUF547 domain-containing protein [Owenweeksia sp.]
MKVLNMTGALLIGASTMAQSDYMGLSQNLLQAMENKNIERAERYVQDIASMDADKLQAQINTQQKKLAFWINLYNGLIQYKLTKDPSLYDDREDFFSDDILTVAGEEVSFDNLEHGVLRRGTSKISKGYFKNPFAGDWHEQYQVDKIDWRIHFALNCGASSCPPVRIYEPGRVYAQLNASSKQYLQSQVRYKKEDEEVYVPKLMSWFSGDFGGAMACAISW